MPPLPEQPGRTPVPARDAAKRQWLHEQDTEGYVMGTVERQCAKAGFDAGWAAREKVNHEPEALDTGSLFPQMGLDHDV